MDENKKETIDNIFGWVQKGLGFVMLFWMIYFHMYIRPISYPMIMIPLVLIGIDIKKLMNR